MEEEVKMRDEQLQDLDRDVKALFTDLMEAGENKATAMTKIRGKMSDYQTALDTLKMEIRSTHVTDKALYKSKAKVFRDNLRQYKNDLAWQERLQNRSELLEEGDHRSNPDLESNDGLINHGLNTQQASKESLQRTMAVTAEAQVMGRETATKLDEQEKQVECMYGDLATIEGNVKRSRKIISRMARKVRTDKYIWVVVFLTIVAIVFIIIYKSMNPELNVNVPQEMHVPNPADQS